MWREHTLLEKSKNGTLFEPVENSKNQYPNDTVHLNDYFWKSGYKTADIEGVKDVLSSQKGVYLVDNGDIDDNTAVAIANYAKANNLTLEQASDKLVELGRMYNEVENIGLNGAEIKQLQIKLNNLGFTDGKGNKLEEDTLLGENTLTVLEKYADEYDMSLSKSVDKLLNRDETWQKAMEDSKKNNIQIKEKENTLQFRNSPNLAMIEAHPQNKVTDEEVLNEFDLMKVNALKGLYKWAVEEGKQLTADMAHKAAVDIRSNPKYNGTGYVTIYVDNFDYSDEFDPDEEFYSLVKPPLDEISTAFLHSNLVDDIVDSGGLSLILQYLSGIGAITAGASVSTDIISQLFTGFGDGIDNYVPTVQEGDIPITRGDKSYYYRPSNGTVIEK